MYELFILLMLMRGPAHGYLIAKVNGDIVGPYGSLSHGRLYPLLARLEQQGLIESENREHGQQGDRQMRIYHITEAGRRRFHQLMMDTTTKRGDYQHIFPYKVSGFEFLTPAERLYLIEHYIGYCEAHLNHLYREAEDILHQAFERKRSWPTERVESILNIIHHWIERWQLDLRWAQQLRESALQLQAQQEETAARPIPGGQQATESH
ncbi:PadR family transcriptional regulator [Thermogemmatispora sp.]|uniref:PadR family transcriptional regulator n=1 Tax=Thermogemmatispora sp. TaxID=1968838 RepID=UPI0035E43E92